MILRRISDKRETLAAIPLVRPQTIVTLKSRNSTDVSAGKALGAGPTMPVLLQVVVRLVPGTEIRDDLTGDPHMVTLGSVNMSLVRDRRVVSTATLFPMCLSPMVACLPLPLPLFQRICLILLILLLRLRKETLALRHPRQIHRETKDQSVIGSLVRTLLFHRVRLNLRKTSEGLRLNRAMYLPRL